MRTKWSKSPNWRHVGRSTIGKLKIWDKMIFMTICFTKIEITDVDVVFMFFIQICTVFAFWFSAGRGGRVLWAVQGLLVGSLALLAGVTLKREAAIHSLNRWLFNRIYALTKQSLKTPVKHIRHIQFSFFSGKSGSLEDSWFPWLRKKELWNMRFASNIWGRGKSPQKGHKS